MRMLTATEIQFIKNYLTNSGVEYIDVRMELTDHIATTLEKQLNDDESLTFYDAFKDYMVIHKKNLLKSDFQNAIPFTIDIVKRFIFSFLGVDVFLFSVFVAFIINRFQYILNTSMFKEINMIILLLSVFMMVLLFKKERKFSLGAKVLSFVFYPLYFLVNNPNPITGLSFLLITLLVTYLYQKYSSRLKQKMGNITFTVLLISFVLVLIFSVMVLGVKSKLLITSKWVAYYMGFKAVLWYVLFKMLYKYKKEINQKYHSILKVS